MENKSSAQLGIFESKARLEIIETLLKCEIMSLSEIRKKLKELYNRQITYQDYLDICMSWRVLESSVKNQEAFFLLLTLRRVYIIQGKDRVKEILHSWDNLNRKLTAGIVFSELTKIARNVFASGTMPQPKDRTALEKMLEKCESEEIVCHLMEDEKKKIMFWKMMVSTTRQFSG